MSSVREAARKLADEIDHLDLIGLGDLVADLRKALEADTVEVPREPTEAMIEAGWAVEELQTPERVYRAMIAAAHEPETGAEG